MRLLVIAAIAAFCLSAQDAKVSAPGALPQTKTDRPLRNEEILAAQLADTQVQLLQKQFNIADYLEKVKVPTDNYNAVKMAACKSVGVPEAEIAQWCGFITGLDQNGKPQLDPSGKPIEAHVFYGKPAPPPVKAADPKK